MKKPTGLMYVHIQRIAELLEYRSNISHADAIPEVIEAIDICIEEQRDFLRELLAAEAPNVHE